MNQEGNQFTPPTPPSQPQGTPPPTYGAPPQTPAAPQQPYQAAPGQQPPYGQQPQQPQQPYQAAPGQQPPYGQQPGGQPYQQQPPQQPYQPQPYQAAPGQQPPYGQQPPQQPGMGQPAYGAAGYGVYQEPPKKKVWPFIALGIALLAIIATVLILTLGRSGGTASLTQDPEAYLAEARGKTLQNFAAAPGPFNAIAADIGDGPMAVDMGFQIRYLEGEPMAEGVSFDMSIQADPNAREMLIDLGVGYGPMKISGNQLYITEDRMAVSVPTLYSRYRYITAETDNFARNWNGSFLRDISPLDNSLDLRSEIASIFDAMLQEDTLSPAYLLLEEQMEQHLGSLFESGTFQSEGRVNQSVNGQTLSLDALSYTYSSSEAKDIYDGFIDLMDDFMQEYIATMVTYGSMYSYGYGYNPYREMLYEWSMAVDFMKDIYFPDGMKITYYVNGDQIINRIEMDDLTIGYQGEPETVTAGFVLDMSGDQSVSENVDMDFWVRSPYNDEIAIRFNQTTTSNGGTTTKEGSFTFLEDGDEEGAISYRIGWEEGNPNGGDMEMAFEVDFGYSVVGLMLDATIYADSNELRMDNGRLDIREDGDSLFSMDFSYGVRRIPGVDIDLSDSIDLFALDEDQFLEDLYSSVMGLMYALY